MASSYLQVPKELGILYLVPWVPVGHGTKLYHAVGKVMGFRWVPARNIISYYVPYYVPCRYPTKTHKRRTSFR